MLIVCAEQTRVEAELAGGLLGCPSCRGVLGPWGHGRARVLRCLAGERLLRPRRGRPLGPVLELTEMDYSSAWGP